MRCERCGNDNPKEASFCVDCGAPLLREKKGRSKKQLNLNSLLLIAILTVVVLLLVCVLIYLGSPDTSNGGEDVNVVITEATEAPVPTERPTPTEQPKPTSAPPSAYDSSKKDYFTEEAFSIEEYGVIYLDNARNQHEINRESAIVYEKWDVLLNEIYNYLKDTMPADEFKKLEKDEIEWVKEKENAIKEEGARWEGGSGQPMAENSVGISYTRERCYYLISLIK